MLKIDDSLGYIICRIARKIHQQLTQKFSQHNITPEQWVLLKTVSEHDGLSQKQLSVYLQKDQNNTKAIADKLVIKQLLSRSSHPTDKRTLSLSITPAGTQLINELLSLDKDMLAELEFPLDDTKKTLLISMLYELETNLDKL